MWHGFKKENELINNLVNAVKREECYVTREVASSGVAHPVGRKKLLEMAAIIGEADPSGRPLNTPGAKADSGKVRPWLMMSGFARALEKVAEVTTKGAEKYTPNGWAEVPNGVDRYMEGFGRHMLKLGQGEVYDNGPNGIGTKHKAQMIWNLLASLELEEREESTS